MMNGNKNKNMADRFSAYSVLTLYHGQAIIK